LVDFEKKPIAEACRLMNLSPSTYYRYKKRFELYGDEGLLNKTLRVDDSPTQLTFQQRNQVLEIIKVNPDLGPTRIRRELETHNTDAREIDDKAIYAELVRLRLNTKRQRFEYAMRMGQALSPVQQEEYERIQETIERPAQTTDRRAYVEQIKESLARKDDSEATVWRTSLEKLGLTDERSDVLTAMFEEMEGQVSPDQLRLLFEKVAGRVRELDKEQESKNVISTARLDEIDEKQWQKRAGEGINLEIITLPDAEPTIDFAEYERKLTGKGRKEESD
jgi:hypothetical protein